MTHQNNIKNAYKDLWKNGSIREEMVKQVLESWGFEVQQFGFMALNDEYNPNWSEESGVPDLVIENPFGKKLYIEVTGTDTLNERSKIWIREHKIKWTLRHPDKHSFCAHVITNKKLIRFIETSTLDLKEVKIREFELHGIPTNFYIIPHTKVLSLEKMKNRLDAWRYRQ